MKYLPLILLIFFSSKSFSAGFEWNGGTGNYDDPSMWNLGVVPGANDDVEISAGTVIFPSSQFYETNNFIAVGNCTLDFRGSNNLSADIHIYGEVKMEASVNLLYEVDSQSTWEFKGAEINHVIDVQNNDLNFILIDDEDSQIELQTPVTTSLIFWIKKGFLDTNGEDINAGTFRAGGSCSGSNCTDKILNLNGSVITCTVEWVATLNYGSLQIIGNYDIIAARFQGGINIVYDKVTLSDYEPNLAGQENFNIKSRNNTFKNLKIDNIYNTKMAGNITVDSEFNVIHPNSFIYISKESNGSTEYWTFNGSVDLPIDQGGCNDFTRFSTSGSIDGFIFQTINSDLVFDNAIIEAIPTEGGGSFTVNNGYVVGYNSDWTVTQNSAVKSLYWIGGSGDWDDGDNWALVSGGQAVGCPPSIQDNVIFDDNSFSAPGQIVTLQYEEFNICRSFTWLTNPHDAKMMDNSVSFVSPVNLYIIGSINVNVPNIFDFEEANFYFIASDEVEIKSTSNLPNSYFISESGYYLFESDCTIKSMIVEAGGFDTQGYDLNIESSLLCKSYQFKYFDLNNSNIIVGFSVNFGDLFNGNVIVDAGTSYINCAKFSSLTDDYNIVEINNIAEILLVDGLFIRKLILNNSSIKVTNDGLEIDSLILNSNNADVSFRYGTYSKINKVIISNASPSNPPKIKSTTSDQTNIEFSPHINCIQGPIEFENINATATGVVRAEEGTDGGGNTGVSFASTPGFTGTLYWTGTDGYFSDLKNWSNGSGGCLTEIEDFSIVQRLVFDDKSFADITDTVRVENALSVGELRFTNTNITANLKLENSLYPKEMVIDGGKLEQTSTTEFAGLVADHHILVENGGYYKVKSSYSAVGSLPSSLKETSFLIKDNTDYICENCSLFLRGHTTNELQPTLKFENNANIYTFNFDLVTAAPNPEEPIRNLYIEGRNVLIDNFILGTVNGASQNVFINESLRAKVLQLNPDNGNFIVRTGALFKVDN